MSAPPPPPPPPRAQRAPRPPLHLCALTLAPHKAPVAAPDGFVFDAANILPLVHRTLVNPISGRPLHAGDLVPLVFDKDPPSGRLRCPMLCTPLDERVKVVAIATTGRVYSAAAISRLNVRAGYMCDLVDGTPFSLADLIVLYDPQLHEWSSRPVRHARTDSGIPTPLASQEACEARRLGSPRHSLLAPKTAKSMRADRQLPPIDTNANAGPVVGAAASSAAAPAPAVAPLISLRKRIPRSTIASAAVHRPVSRPRLYNPQAHVSATPPSSLRRRRDPPYFAVDRLPSLHLQPAAMPPPPPSLHRSTTPARRLAASVHFESPSGVDQRIDGQHIQSASGRHLGKHSGKRPTPATSLSQARCVMPPQLASAAAMPAPTGKVAKRARLASSSQSRGRPRINPIAPGEGGMRSMEIRSSMSVTSRGDEERRAVYKRIRKGRKGKGYVRVVTNIGHLNIELHCDKVPSICDNFLTLADRKYYDGLVWHRVVPGFIAQTGDPTGSGDNGDSAWGGFVKDEIRASLNHDAPGVVSMANSGRDTNRSQWFVCFDAASHLDGAHSVFGKVVGGLYVLKKMEDEAEMGHPLTVERVEVLVNPIRQARKQMVAEAAMLKADTPMKLGGNALPREVSPQLQILSGVSSQSSTLTDGIPSNPPSFEVEPGATSHSSPNGTASPQVVGRSNLPPISRQTEVRLELPSAKSLLSSALGSREPVMSLRHHLR